MTATYHHGNLKTALLDEGYRMARRSGLESIGLREVAKNCGITPAAVYRHFTDREELIRSISALARKKLASRMNSSLAHRPELLPEEKLRIIGEAYIKYASEKPSEFKIAFVRPNFEELENSPTYPWHILETTMNEISRKHGWNRDTTEQMKILSWSTVHGLGSLIADGALPPYLNHQEMIDSTLTSVLNQIQDA